MPKSCFLAYFVIKFFQNYIPNLIEEAKLFKNTNLVVEPEFTSGKATQLEVKFDLGSNLNGYISEDILKILSKKRLGTCQTLSFQKNDKQFLKKFLNNNSSN